MPRQALPSDSGGITPGRDSRADRLQAALDVALEQAAARSDDVADHFPLVAYAAANRIAARLQTPGLAVAVREPISTGVSWLSRNIAGRGPAVTVECGERRADLVFVAGTHRTDHIGKRSYGIPIDPLKLALEGAGFTTALLHYRTPEPIAGAGRIVYHRAAGPVRSGSRSGVASAAIVVDAIRRLGRRSPLLLAPWLGDIVALTGIVRDALSSHWRRTPVRGVIVCGGVDSFTGGAVLAARDLGLPSFELQHGHLRRFDPRISSNLAGGGVIADHFLAWTAATPLAGTASRIVVGAPLRLMRSAYAERAAPGLNAALDSEKQRIAASLSQSGSKLGLVSRQPGMDIEAAALAAANALGIEKLLWRGHPRELRDQSDPLDRLATTAPLGLVLEAMAAHFTHSSAAALEAFDVGVATHFLSKRGSGLMLDAAEPRPDHPATVEEAIGRIGEIIGRSA